MNKKSARYYGAALLAMFFWSLSFVWFKVAYKAYEPMTVVLLRLSFAAVIILIFSIAAGKLEKLKKEDRGWMLFLSFFEPFLYFMGESFGLKYISPTIAAVIISTIPLFTTLAAWYFHNETLSRVNFAGLLLSFAGVTLVVFDTTYGLSASPLGLALEFLAVLSTIGYAVILKRLTARYNGYTIITWQNGIGAFMFFPFWLIFESAATLQTPFNAEAFAAILKLAVFASILGFIFFTYSIRNIGINRSNMFVNVIPVFVAIFSFLILGDELNVQKAAGIAVVVSGLFLAGKKGGSPAMLLKRSRIG
ncbi:MAG: DMT family transporter [Prolixibacteraceae bacterium]